MLTVILIKVLLIPCFLLSQSTVIKVYTLPGNNKLNQFYKELLENVVEIHNKKSQQKYTLMDTVFEDVASVVNKIKDLHDSRIRIIGCLPFTIDHTESYGKFFSYSIPILPVKDAVLAFHTNTKKFEKQHSFNLGLVKNKNNTYYYDLARKLKSMGYTFQSTYFDTYDQLIPALYEKKVDFIIGDSIDGWLDKKIQISYEFGATPQFLGFKYQKNTLIKDDIDKVLSYYKKSKTFYSLLRKYFGKNFRDYYIKTANLN